MKKVTYLGNNVETYDLYYDGEICAELPVGEDGAKEITEKINTYLSIFKSDKYVVNIQNDSSKDLLGVIVDVYKKYADGEEEFIDGVQYWFEDFTD